MRVVDVHNHITPRGFLDRTPQDEGQPGLSVRPLTESGGDFELVFRGTDVGSLAEEHTYPVVRREFDAQERLRWMARDGIDVQIMTASPMLFRYGGEAGEVTAHCKRLNDELAEISHAHPKSFVSLAMLPAQDAEASVKELRRAMLELSMPGVQLGANVWGEDLDSPRLRPIFEAANELGAVVFVHPAVSQSPPGAVASMSRLGDFYLRNLLGNPIDTTISLARILYSGMLDELPNIRFIFAHAGGYAPMAIGRLDHGYRVRPERTNLGRLPSEHLRRIYVDTIAHLPAALRLLADVVGPRQVLLGSDYPYDMGPDDPVGDVRAAGFSAEVETRVLSTNAMELFGLDEEEASLK